MDPLSISAALVTFLGASATVVGFLEELCSLRKAPAAILALNNEISDLRLLFHGLNNLTQQRHDVSIASSTILPTLEKAQEKVRELEVILERRVIKRQLPSGQTEIDRIAWLRNKPKIQEIHDSFRDVKLNIATALGAVSS
jgi:hypothetical protein